MTNKKSTCSHICFLQRIFALTMMLGIATLCIAASLLSENTFFVYKGDDVTAFTSRSSNVAKAFEESGIVISEAEYVVMPDKVQNGIAKLYIYPKKKIIVKISESEKILYSEKEISVSELLEENNIPITEKEILSTPGTDKIFDGMEIEIIPKKVVTLVIANTQNILYAEPGISVSDFLAQNNIILSATDIISIPVTEKIQEDIRLEITRIVYTTREESVSVPFSVINRENKSMRKGTSKVIQSGKDGSKKVVYNITLTNGIETGKTVASETTITEAVPKIVEYGTNSSGVIKTKFGNLEYKDCITMTATAYTTEGSSDKITATGAVARVGLVAVDRRVIPLGTRLYIEAADGKSWCYGIAVAGDTGVRGKKIDLFFNTRHECFSFGVRKAKVYILK